MRNIFNAARTVLVVAGVVAASASANAATYSVWGANVTYPEQQAAAAVGERGAFVALAPDEVRSHGNHAAKAAR